MTRAANSRATRDDLGKRRDVAFHREHAVDDDEPPCGPRRRCASGGAGRRDRCGGTSDLAEGQPRAVDDARVVLLVEVDDVAVADEARDRAEVDLEAGGEGDGRLLPHEVREPLLELAVRSSVPFRKRLPAQPVPYRRMRLDGGLLDPRIVGEAEVVVRAEHDHAAAADGDLGILRGLDDPEEGVEPRPTHALGVLEPVALLEEAARGPHGLRAGSPGATLVILSRPP